MKNITNFRLFLSTLLFFFLSTSAVRGQTSCGAYIPAAGDCGYDGSTYKILCPFGGTNIVSIQNPWGGGCGIYVIFSGEVTACSLGAGNYEARGGGLLMYMTNFESEETVVTVTAGGVNHTFTVYNKNGTSGGGVSCDTKHFYYVKIGGTAYTNVYMWNSSNTSEKNANWPGVTMSTTVPELSILGAYIYEITYEGANYDQVIFNDGTNQTGDLDIENCK